MSIWWLSFCSVHRPRGKQFIGACIVAGRDFTDAVNNANEQSCNPGGEVLGSEMLPHIVMMIPITMRNVLLNAGQVDKIVKLTAPS